MSLTHLVVPQRVARPSGSNFFLLRCANLPCISHDVTDQTWIKPSLSIWMELPIHLSNTSPFFAEASFKANVEKILDFLITDTTYATDVTEKELDLAKVHVETVNAFIVVVRDAQSHRHCIAHLGPRF